MKYHIFWIFYIFGEITIHINEIPLTSHRIFPYNMSLGLDVDDLVALFIRIPFSVSFQISAPNVIIFYLSG